MTAKLEPQVYSSPGRTSDLGSHFFPYMEAIMTSCQSSPVAHLDMTTDLSSNFVTNGNPADSLGSPEQHENSLRECLEVVVAVDLGAVH